MASERAEQIYKQKTSHVTRWVNGHGRRELAPPLKEKKTTVWSERTAEYRRVSKSRKCQLCFLVAQASGDCINCRLSGKTFPYTRAGPRAIVVRGLFGLPRKGENGKEYAQKKAQLLHWKQFLRYERAICASLGLRLLLAMLERKKESEGPHESVSTEKNGGHRRAWSISLGTGVRRVILRGFSL